MNSDEKIIERIQSGKYKAVIFDFDGTILDIKKVLTKSIMEAFHDSRIYADLDQATIEIGAILESVQGIPISKILLDSHELTKYITALKDQSFMKKLKIITKIFSNYQTESENADIFPSTKPLLEILKKSGKIYITSHNKQSKILEHLKKNKIEDYFAGVYGADELDELKPDPRAFTPILKECEAKVKDKFLVIGDMPTDIVAAREAGFDVIAVVGGISTKETLLEYGPHMIIKSLADLVKKITNEANGRISKNKVNETLKIKS